MIFDFKTMVWQRLTVEDPYLAEELLHKLQAGEITSMISAFDFLVSLGNDPVCEQLLETEETMRAGYEELGPTIEVLPDKDSTSKDRLFAV